MKKNLYLLVALTVLLSLLTVPAWAASGADLLKGADLHLTFDDELIEDANRNYDITDAGSPTPIVDGRFGKAAHIDVTDNYLIVEEMSLGTSSFTFSTWLYINEHSGDPVLIANKDWGSGKNPGWAVCIQKNR